MFASAQSPLQEAGSRLSTLHYPLKLTKFDESI